MGLQNNEKPFKSGCNSEPNTNPCPTKL